MNKLFDNHSNLTPDGKRVFVEFDTALHNIMHCDQVNDMTESELLLLGTHMHKIIGEAITKKISQKKQLQHRLAAMTDQQFQDYLKDKYGEMWFITSLEPEECERVPLQDYDKMLEEIETAITNFTNCNGVRLE
jgi:hypothetical protein